MDYQDSMSDTPSDGWFSKIVDAGKSIYTANRQAAAAEAQADGNKANAAASILSSKNMMIAGVVVAVALVVFLFFKSRK